MRNIKRRTIANLNYDSSSIDTNIPDKGSNTSLRKGLRTGKQNKSTSDDPSDGEKELGENITELKLSYMKKKKKKSALDKNAHTRTKSMYLSAVGNTLSLKRGNTSLPKTKGKIMMAYPHLVSKYSTNNVKPQIEESVKQGNDQEEKKEKEKEKEVEDEYGEVGDVNSEVGDVDSEVEDVNSEVEDANSEVEDVNSEVEDVNSEVEDVNSEVEDVNSEVENANNEVEDVNSEVENANYEVEKKSNEEEDKEQSHRNDEGRRKKISSKRESIFQRLATANTISSSNKIVNEKLRKQFTENIYSIMKMGPTKSFNVKLDNNITYSSFMPYNKARKLNMEKKLNIMKAKSQMLKIAEKYMSTDKMKSCKMMERRNTQSLIKNIKLITEGIEVWGPFLPKKREEIKATRKLGYVPNYLKEIITEREKSNNWVNGELCGEMDNITNGIMSNKFNGESCNKSRNNLTQGKNGKMVLRKSSGMQGFTLFENMIALNNIGKVYVWDGYQWKNIKILYESFLSISTTKNGYIICINRKFKPGYLMNNKYFHKMDTFTDTYFLKIVTSIKNKIWGINLRGELQKWNKYEWKEEKKAYGISKLKSLAFDRNNKLWVLDQQDYFYIFDIEYNNWMLKNINGTNIKDFDFNENNFLVAVTNHGMIKIYKNNKWIKYGILAEMKIASFHFIRRVEE
ncbi:conserved Plasmodium protein, unknown function [Plasmodium malariae]|uniref:Uncharacterized protein n=1 Tax=Plasmodium malariae TaxID=5858 RepID=A0A1D3RIR5_PLAMA|nr:conserved Plasmodium protein, unknown function [Plasmodium malariae]SCN44846.1 conserved Plasmodium protein, unknown function [Plasmodium malariae]